MTRIAAILAGVALVLLVVWAFSEGSDSKEKVLVRKGVSLQENMRPAEDTLRWGRTPVPPAWHELLRRSRAQGWRGKTNGPLSGMRTHSQQKRLWVCFQRGLCPPAFHPNGPSRHLRRSIQSWGQWSQAVDVSRPRQLMLAGQRLGVPLWQPYDSEPWHIEALFAWSLPDVFRWKKTEGSRPLWMLVAALLLFAGAGGVLLGCLLSQQRSRSVADANQDAAHKEVDR